MLGWKYLAGRRQTTVQRAISCGVDLLDACAKPAGRRKSYTHQASGMSSRGAAREVTIEVEIATHSAY
jgi:hypothetical protein